MITDFEWQNSSGCEAKGNGVSIVVRGRESLLQGEGTQEQREGISLDKRNAHGGQISEHSEVFWRAG